MSDAFISYRRDPSFGIAVAVREKLKNQHNIDAYLDVESQDSNKVPFPERLEGAIEEASTFICFLADTTLDSEWVRKEIRHAYELKKHCIPVFQETYKQPLTGDEAVDYLLSFDGVHIFDKRGVMPNESVANIARLIIRKTSAQPQLSSITEISTQKLPKANIILGDILLFLLITGVIIWAIIRQSGDIPVITPDAMNTTNPTHTLTPIQTPLSISTDEPSYPSNIPYQPNPDNHPQSKTSGEPPEIEYFNPPDFTVAMSPPLTVEEIDAKVTALYMSIDITMIVIGLFVFLFSYYMKIRIRKLH